MSKKTAPENTVIVPDADKMKSLERMASILAHDLNNILQVVSGYSQLLKEMIEPDSDIDRYVDYIVDGGRRARRLVDNLVKFTGAGKHSLSAVEVDRILRDTTSKIEDILVGGQKLKIEQGAPGKFVMAEELVLEDAIIELCANASEATKNGGDITVRTVMEESGPKDSNAPDSAQAGQFVCLEVIDTGFGIPPDAVDKVFDPFFTTKAKGEGLGLGLTTVYAAARECDGWVELYTKEGEGTTAKLRFPLSSEQDGTGDETEPDLLAGSEEGAGVREEKPTSELTILIAEDEEMVRNFTSNALRRFGFKVLEAENGSIALRMFEEAADEIDLLLLDVLMPSMRGTEVRDEIRRRGSDLPVIFITGYSESHTSADFGQLPDNEMILYKPCEVKKIIAAIKSLT